MKSRLLAAILSVSLLFGSMPVTAAEPGSEKIASGGVISSIQDTASDKDVQTSDSDTSNKTSSDEGSDNKDTSNEGVQDANASGEAISIGDTPNDGSSTDDSSNKNASNADSSNEDNSNKDDSSNGSSNEGASNENTSNDDSSNQDNDNTQDNGNNQDGDNTQDSDIDNSGENTGDDAASSDAETGEETDSNTEADTDEQPADDTALEEEAETPVYTEESDITELSVGNNPLDIVNDSENSTRLYYSFTAPEAGYYNFHMDDTDAGYYNMKLYTDNSYNNSFRQIDDYSSNVHTDYMDMNDTVYMCFGVSSGTNTASTLSINKLELYTGQKQADGSYSFNMSDYILSIRPETGNSCIRVNESIEANGEDTQVTDTNYFDLYLNDIDSAYTANSIIDASISKDNRSGKYESSYTLSADAGKRYNLQFLLRDSGSYDSNVSAIFIIDDIFSITNATNDAVTIHSVEKNETSITMDIESSDFFSCYYAPVGSPEEEKVYGLGIYDWRKYTFDYLKPNTVYRFEFVNSDGKIVYTYEESTDTLNVTYTCEQSEEDSTTYIFKAEVSGYTGSASSAHFKPEYTNALGDVITPYCNYVSGVAAEDGTKSFTMEWQLRDADVVFEAGKTYDIKLDIEIGAFVLASKTERLTMPASSIAADDLTFNVAKSEAAVNYSVSANSLQGDDKLRYQIYYKEAGSKNKYDVYPASMTHLTAANNSITETIFSSLPQYGSYDFVIIAGGVKKIKTLDFSSDFTLTKVGSDEINAFDFVCTYKLESVGNSTAPNGDYTLELYYYDNASYQSLVSGIALNADNNYQATVMTAADNEKLNSNTDYDLKWEVKSGNNIVYTSYETIRTAQPQTNVDENTANCSFNSMEFQITLAQADMANFTDFGTVYLNSYIKKTGSGNNYRKKGNNIILSSSNSYSDNFSIGGLEAGTSYDLEIRSIIINGSKEIVYASTTFTTPADGRVLSTEVNASFHSAEIDYTLTGLTDSMRGSVVCYIREKGSTDGVWSLADYNSYFTSYSTFGTLHISNINGTELKDNTEYEYKIGLGSYYDTYIYLDNLDKVIDGSFKTNSDNRTLSQPVISESYTSVDICSTLSGNDEYSETYIYLFLRSSADTTWAKAYGYDKYGYYGDYQSNYADTFDYTIHVDGLSSDTQYDYVLIVSDSYDCTSPNEVASDKRKASGTFETKKNNYTFDFTTDVSKLTHNTAVVNVAAKGGDDEKLQVVFTAEDKDGNIKNSDTVTLKAAEGYKANVTFANLLGNTEYTIKNADISLIKGNYNTDIGSVVCGHKFTTKEVEAPTAITLSEIKIALNALYSSYYAYDGYNTKTLKAGVTPATAAKDFIWSSSDRTVATVDENGQVRAAGVGAAKITVKSAYDENIKAECEVTVKKYAVGHKYQDENGADKIEFITGFYSDGFALYRNSYIEGMGLYDYSDVSSPELLDDYTASSQKEKIAEVNGDKLFAYNPGKTYIDFEKDGIKTRFVVKVSAEGRGFGVTGFDQVTGFDPIGQYPAIKESDGSYTLAYDANSTIGYYSKIEVTPKQSSCPTDDFNWSIAETDIAQVTDTGVITPLKAGTATLTVTPKKYYTTNEKPYKTTEFKVTLNIKSLPAMGNSNAPLYALANVHTKIGDVEFPKDGWDEGWSWKYPDTPLVTNGVYGSYHSFKAVYSGKDNYPCEADLPVYIGKVTGANVTEYTISGDYAHYNVLETGGNDLLKIRVNPLYQGEISANSDLYKVELPNVNGLTIEQDESNKYIFKIKASKKGSYTLKPVIKAGDKTLATAAYKIKAVDEKQAGSITLTSATEGVIISSNPDGSYFVLIDKANTDAKKEFTITAAVKDRQGAESETALVWKTTDKAVAQVASSSKTETHTAKVTIKGSGHTVITAAAKDAAGFSARLNLEVQDHSPRIDTDKANVNIAYDYNDDTGKEYASSTGGIVEIVPVYTESISTVEMRDKEDKAALTDFKIERYTYAGSHKYLIQPASDSLSAGKYDCSIHVTTSAGIEYKYPVKVTVTDKSPNVSAKMSGAPNLFFKDTGAVIYLKISGAVDNDTLDFSSVSWTSASDKANTGFKVSYDGYDSKKKQPYIVMAQDSGLKLTNGKLEDAAAAKGKLSLKLKGYKKVYPFENFTIKYTYKKPALVTKPASSNIAPDAGQNNSTDFYVYDKTNKRDLGYSTTDAGSYNYYYDEITSSVSDIELHPSKWEMYYSYNGTEKSKKFTLTLDAPLWREPLTASHTMKKIKPTAYLEYNTITYNTNLKSTVSNYVYLKNARSISLSDIEIKGANAKAQKLLDDDLFVITAQPDYSNEIEIAQSRAEFMGSSIPAGTYSFKVTPYYNAPGTNTKTALNTVTFKLKVINKPVTAKVSPKGSIDLTYGAYSTPYDRKNTVTLVDPKFSNMADGYYVSSCKLTGEYSKYFTLGYDEYYGKCEGAYIYYGKKYAHHYYIGLNDRSSQKLKAGQAYKLAIEYTVNNGEGETFKVTSNTFKIKPKQSAAKVTVKDNNQTLYAGADNFSRRYNLSVPSYYRIESASGSLDCNKDGTPDIKVSGSYNLTVRISDSDAVGATEKGKSYSIPVTVKLVGRDGIAKDVKTTIKVKIKR